MIEGNIIQWPNEHGQKDPQNATQKTNDSATWFPLNPVENSYGSVSARREWRIDKKKFFHWSIYLCGVMNNVPKLG